MRDHKLYIRLRPETEAELKRFARAKGRPVSAMVREWILEELERAVPSAPTRP